MKKLPRGCGVVPSLGSSSFFDILERYQMALPCPSAGNMITSGVVGFDATMAPGRDVNVRLLVLLMRR